MQAPSRRSRAVRSSYSSRSTLSCPSRGASGWFAVLRAAVRLLATTRRPNRKRNGRMLVRGSSRCPSHSSPLPRRRPRAPNHRSASRLYRAAVADIAPFTGIRYDPAAVGDVARVVAPPYDVISPKEREALEDASPYNVVRLILPRDEHGDDGPERYGQARALLDAWLAAGVLREDDDESITVYEQRYTIGGERRVQRGVLASVALEGLLPHERTYEAIVADRLELLRATQYNLDAIFCVYESQDAAAQHAIDALCASE